MTVFLQTIRFLLLYLCYAGVSQATLSCHIHAPPNKGEKDKPVIIGPYGTMAQCEQANHQMFIGRGRCHCNFDSPRLTTPNPEMEREKSTELLY